MPIVSNLVSEVTVFSTVAPPFTITGEQLDAMLRTRSDAPAAPSEAGGGAWGFVKPTVFVESPILGPFMLAPYGAAGPDDWKETRRGLYWRVGLTAAALVGIGFLLGRAGKR
jgi:hypothetical protein